MRPNDEQVPDPDPVFSASETDSFSAQKVKNLLLLDAIRNGLDLDMFMYKPAFSFFPEKIDKPTVVDYDVSAFAVNGCVIHGAPGMSHLRVSVLLKGSGGKC